MSRLIFSWDQGAGRVSGRDADQVRQIAASGGVDAHPAPRAWEFGPEPLKSFVDMAAIVGSRWVLPAELQKYYPLADDDGLPATSYTDADGLIHIGRDAVTF